MSSFWVHSTCGCLPHSILEEEEDVSAQTQQPGHTNLSGLFVLVSENTSVLVWEQPLISE